MGRGQARIFRKVEWGQDFILPPGFCPAFFALPRDAIHSSVAHPLFAFTLLRGVGCVIHVFKSEIRSNSSRPPRAGDGQS
jgi:hypothetical protein